MKQLSISQLKQLKTDEIKNSGCFEVTSDGEVVATVIVGGESLMKDRIRALASQLDAALGK